MKIIGIDPGLSGALALLNAEGLTVFDVPAVKARRGRGREVLWPEVARWVDNVASESHINHAVIEAVGAMPKQGVSSMFKFGYVCGGLHVAMAMSFIPVTFVTPAQWKRDMGLPKGKDAARARAMELFPRHSGLFVRKKDDGRAEAALIALWGRRSLAAGMTSPSSLRAWT